jgi:hypothetical protein
MRALQRIGALPLPPPVPLPVLEAAMQRFLEQLERLGQRLDGDRDENGLWPWIVAGGAAAAACEIARRQLRRPRGVPALPGDRLPDSPTQTPFTG